ncbi:TraB/GumN family protein [Colwellia piezophila]|uniref:TraB/GumN family protein n=1 Tax=Colwellia piezophila TaxID=211668 RepID=UPI000368D454|nr:TraB/GumN family protein [Colwellia piezophila]
MIKTNFKHLLMGVSLITGSLISFTSVAESSVWKVSKGDDHIFIGGTVHILPPAEFPLPAEFDQAYKKSDSIVLETKIPDASDTAFQIKMMQQMAYGEGKTIGDFVSARTKQDLSKYITSLGADLMMFERFKPGFLMTLLVMLEAQKAGFSGEGVDIFYSKKATRDNKTIEYFETVEFQMNMIADMGEGNEEKFIQSNLEQMKDFKTMFTGLLSAWRSGDVQKLNKLAIEPMKDDPKTLKALLTDRNHHWVKDIKQMFNDNDKEFVLVGVAHLVGDNSVLALLKANGYRVEKL